MKDWSVCVAGSLLIVLTGCGDSYDRMARKMMFDSYRAQGTRSLADVNNPAETLYYLQKYGASAAQKQQAVDAAQRFLMRQTGSTRSSANPILATANTRYIAVPVAKSSQSRGKLDVMLFDTQSRQLAGNEVYDLQAIPSTQTELKFDTYNAQFVGKTPFVARRADDVNDSSARRKASESAD